MAQEMDKRTSINGKMSFGLGTKESRDGPFYDLVHILVIVLGDLSA
jgi:hypothetical protein